MALFVRGLLIPALPGRARLSLPCEVSRAPLTTSAACNIRASFDAE